MEKKIIGQFATIIPNGSLIENIGNIISTTLDIMKKKCHYTLILVDRSGEEDDGIISSMPDELTYFALKGSIAAIEKALANKTIH